MEKARGLKPMEYGDKSEASQGRKKALGAPGLRAYGRPWGPGDLGGLEKENEALGAQRPWRSQ